MMFSTFRDSVAELRSNCSAICNFREATPAADEFEQRLPSDELFKLLFRLEREAKLDLFMASDSVNEHTYTFTKFVRIAQELRAYQIVSPIESLRWRLNKKRFDEYNRK